MRSIRFGAHNRSGDVLHVEAPGCVINIHVNLTDCHGRRVTRVDIRADRYPGEPEWEIDGLGEHAAMRVVEGGA